jgi:hypothetical protein
MVRAAVAVLLLIFVAGCGSTSRESSHGSTPVTQPVSGSGLVARPVPSHSRQPLEYCGTRIAGYVWPVVVAAARLSDQPVRVGPHSQVVIEVARSCAQRVQVQARGALRILHAYPSPAGSVAVEVSTAAGVGTLELISAGHTETVSFPAA